MQTDWANISLFVTAVTGLIVALSKLWLDVKRNDKESRERDKVQSSRSDQIWEGRLMRGDIEAGKLKEPRYDGPVTPESVTVQDIIRDDVRKAYQDLMPAFREIRRGHPKITKVQFAEMVQGLYRFEIMQICRRFDIREYACLSIAWELSEEGREVGWDSDKMRARA